MVRRRVFRDLLDFRAALPVEFRLEYDPLVGGREEGCEDLMFVFVLVGKR
jgi:hypothetical protein